MIDDKTRMLMTIIRELSSTQVCVFHMCNGDELPLRCDDRQYVHFESTLNSGRLNVGDLVLCETSGTHDFTVGFIHEKIGYSDCIVREIGSNRTCKVSNERFTKIVGLSDSQLLEGAQYRFRRKVLKAFRWGEYDYKYRFGGLRFEGKNGRTAVISVREKWGTMVKSIPFDVVIKWNTKTTIKFILEEMTKQGYGWKEFERQNKEQVI